MSDTDAEHAGHPKDRQYVAIAGVLAVITAIEVALTEIDLGNATNPLLLIGMAIKFFIVAAFFMHLRFDNKIFQRLLVVGLLLAIGCYVAMIAMFRVLPAQDKEQDIRFTPSGIPQS